jgi:hypothetical protein
VQRLLLRKLLALLLLALSAHSSASVQNTEIEAIELQRQGLLNLLTYMDSKPDLFARSPEETLLLNREQKTQALSVWLLYLDYMSTLHQLADETENYLSLRGDARKQRQQLHALAFTAHYRFGLEFIARVKHDSELVKWYNTPQAEQELPKNFYRRFSNEILGEWMTNRFDQTIYSLGASQSYATYAALEADRTAISDFNRISLLSSNSASMVGRSLYNTYYPVQKGVARGMGKIKVWRIGETLITPEQALEFSRAFEPGDFYLTRKEWRMTNVGIPGFWTHSAMFIGTPEERAIYFDEPEIHAWVESKGASSFEDLLKQTSEIYAAHPGVDAWGDIRVIEALDAGVIFNSIETSLDADGAAVFRPLVSKLEKAKAIYNSFYYTGQPYDFHFDFDSDTALVCSELIFKAYQPATDQEGVDFPLSRAVGKKMLTPSEIAQWYEETVGTPEQEIELVMFIDSNEKDRVAFQSTKEAFIGSWKRPDWYIFQQPPMQAEQRDEQSDERLAQQ